MIDRIGTHWWLFLIRGILALAFGFALPFFPLAALFTIAILFGFYAILDGIVASYAAFRMSHTDGRWVWLTIEGIIGLAAGTYALFAPGVAILALAWLLGAWALVTGILALGSAFTVRRHVANEIFWVLGALVSIVFGIGVFFAPAIGAWALIYFLSFYAIVAGFIFISLAMRLRGVRAAKPPRDGVGI
jgi:uncharacterized membrane protein HdeD (DUF308 family)